MCLKPQAIPDVPPEMVRVVRAVFPKGNLYIHLRDDVGTIYQDEFFEDLYPDRATCLRCLAAGSGHGFPIYGESDGSAGS